MTEEENALRNQLKAKLNAETGKLSWPELERYFARGAVIKVDSTLDLIEVAAAVADDDKEAVECWMNGGKVGHPEIEDAKDWVERQPSFWAVVVAPWILVQEVKE